MCGVKQPPALCGPFLTAHPLCGPFFATRSRHSLPSLVHLPFSLAALLARLLSRMLPPSPPSPRRGVGSNRIGSLVLLRSNAALKFDEYWSAVEAFPAERPDRPAWRPLRAFERTHGPPPPPPAQWPSHHWWRRNRSDASLSPPAGAPRYSWLGHHDVYTLPAIRDFIKRRGDSPFFLMLQTVATHHPYVGSCPHASAEGADGARPPPRLARPPASREFPAYLRELHCVDWWIGQVYQLLRRASRLHDTSIVVIADHGEGFEKHMRGDRVHGGAVYESQMRLPFVAFGPIAQGLPKRIAGVWSDTDVAPTLLEALTGRTTAYWTQPASIAVAATESTAAAKTAANIANGADSANAAAKTAASPPPPFPASADWLSSTAAAFTPSLADLFGTSILSRAWAPPRHAFMSCAFDTTCAGLRVQPTDGAATKFISWSTNAPQRAALEVYFLDEDADEAYDRGASIPARTQAHIADAIYSWVRAVQELHASTLYRPRAGYQ